MKKSIVFLTMVAFVGISAFSFNMAEKEDPAKAAKSQECGQAVNAVLTGGVESAAGCDSDAKVTRTADAAKSQECGQAVNAVLAGGSGAEKSGDCSQPCESAAIPTVAETEVECDDEDEKSDETRIAGVN